MRVLVACEESQAVCKEFRKLGHYAISCDIQDCSGGFPEWHCKTDVLSILNGDCSFEAQDGSRHIIVGKWDMIIAFPPCTHLAVSGARHFKQKRDDGRQEDAIKFFLNIMNAPCDKIAIENPVGIMSGGNYIKQYFPQYYLDTCKPSQIIQPYEYGHTERKATCLWLHGLPLLQPTHIVDPELEWYTYKDGTKKSYSKGFSMRNAKERSKTYPGIAKAMAQQWGKEW